MKKIFLCVVVMLFWAASAPGAELSVITTSPWVAVIVKSIGGAYVHAVSLTNWDGTRIRGRDAPQLKNTSDIIAIDAAESASLGIFQEEYPNLSFMYDKAPFKRDEKEYYFGDPSALPFIAQKIFRILAIIDKDNFLYYQRQLAVFQTRLNSAILAGRHLLRGLRVFDLTGGSGYFLVAAGCDVTMPQREHLKQWSRGQQLNLLTEAMRNIRAVNGVAMIDEGTSKPIKSAVGENAVIVAFSRPPLDQDFFVFIHNQYLRMWEQVKDKVPSQ